MCSSWSRWRGQRGSIAVETALTLPVVILLTLGGLSVLWWLHNQTWLHLFVSEMARERAADAAVTGYYKDVAAMVNGLPPAWGLPQGRVFSLHLPTDPPMVLAAVCSAPSGVVPQVNGLTGQGKSPGADRGIPVIRDAREVLEDVVDTAHDWESEAEDALDEALTISEQLRWYKRAVANLTGQREYLRRQSLDYLVGGLVEAGMRYPCTANAQGGPVLTAKAVIQGERTYAQK